MPSTHSQDSRILLEIKHNSSECESILRGEPGCMVYAYIERRWGTQTLNAGVTIAFLELGIVGLEWFMSWKHHGSGFHNSSCKGESLEIRMQKLSFLRD